MRRKIHLIVEDLNKTASLLDVDDNFELLALLIESSKRLDELSRLEADLESNKLEMQRYKDLMHSYNIHL